MNDGGHMHGGSSAAPMAMRRRHMMMHMTFFWGDSAEILFDGWPGRDRPGMYALALAVVFLLAVAMEWLSHCNILRRQPPAAAAAAQTAMYAVRIGMAYLVMLAVMSFNAGVFLAAVAGHGVGFFLFGSRAFKKTPPAEGVGWKTASDLPPMNCC